MQTLHNTEISFSAKRQCNYPWTSMCILISLAAADATFEPRESFN